MNRGNYRQIRTIVLQIWPRDVDEKAVLKGFIG